MAVAVAVAVVCRVLCVVIWSVATLRRDSWLLLPFTSACLEILATLTFGALRETITKVGKHEKKKTRTMKPRRPRVVSNVSRTLPK